MIGEATYGSDKDGLVCAYLFVPGQAAALVDADEAAGWLRRARSYEEEAAAQINERTSRILFLLTLVTVLALPFNVIGGLFGMNVAGIPFAQHPYGFWLVVIIVAGFTFAVTAIAWRNRDR